MDTLPTVSDLGDALIELFNDRLAAERGFVGTDGLELLDLTEDEAIEAYGPAIAETLCHPLEGWTPEGDDDAGFRPWAMFNRRSLRVSDEGLVRFGGLAGIVG